MNTARLATRLAPKFVEEFIKQPTQPCRIFLSASDMNSPAVVRYAVADNPADAFNAALEQLNAALDGITPTILRADWIVGDNFNIDLPKLEPTKMVKPFDTCGVFVSDDEEPTAIDTSGHRSVSLTADLLDEIIRRGIRYLEEQLLDSGRFIYGRLPCTDRFVPSYDAAHHRLAISALQEAYDIGGGRDDRLREEIGRAVKFDMKELPSNGNSDDEAAARNVTEADVKAILDAHFYPEVAMFFKRPSMITGGFFSRDDEFRVRIDDAARALIDLIEYRKNAAPTV